MDTIRLGPLIFPLQTLLTLAAILAATGLAGWLRRRRRADAGPVLWKMILVGFVTARAVFVLRDVEGLSIEETASFLSIKPETVRSRLHRARKLMRTAIEQQLSGAFASSLRPMMPRLRPLARWTFATAASKARPA